MQTRWMLYMEEGSALHLLRTVPRKWLEDTKKIELLNVKSYFGSLTVKVQFQGCQWDYRSHDFNVLLKVDQTRWTIRLPHPENKKTD